MTGPTTLRGCSKSVQRLSADVPSRPYDSLWMFEVSHFTVYAALRVIYPRPSHKVLVSKFRLETNERNTAYITHTLHIHYTYTTHTLHIHYTYTTHTLHIHYTYTTHTLHIHYTYTTHTLHIHYIYTTHTLHITYTYITHYAY